MTGLVSARIAVAVAVAAAAAAAAAGGGGAVAALLNRFQRRSRADKLTDSFDFASKKVVVHTTTTTTTRLTAFDPGQPG